MAHGICGIRGREGSPQIPRCSQDGPSLARLDSARFAQDDKSGGGQGLILAPGRGAPSDRAGGARRSSLSKRHRNDGRWRFCRRWPGSYSQALSRAPRGPFADCQLRFVSLDSVIAGFLIHWPAPSMPRQVPDGERLCAQLPGNEILGDQNALNMRLGTEVSAHRGALFLRRRSANRTFEIERRVIETHSTRVLPHM